MTKELVDLELELWLSYPGRGSGTSPLLAREVF